MVPVDSKDCKTVPFVYYIYMSKKKSKETMSRISFPKDIANAIHKKAVLADYKTNWEYVAAKCL